MKKIGGEGYVEKSGWFNIESTIGLCRLLAEFHLGTKRSV